MLLVPALLLPGLAAAREPAPVMYDPTAADSRYVHNYRIPVGEGPGRVIRIYELRRVFRHAPPTFASVRAREMREQGFTDTADENGEEYARVTFFLEDGNTIHGDYRGTVRSFRWPDGTRHFDLVGEITLSGGTGRFALIRGSISVRLALDPGAESSQGKSAGEYWFEEPGGQLRGAPRIAGPGASVAAGRFHIALARKTKRSGEESIKKQGRPAGRPL